MRPALSARARASSPRQRQNTGGHAVGFLSRSCASASLPSTFQPLAGMRPASQAASLMPDRVLWAGLAPTAWFVLLQPSRARKHAWRMLQALILVTHPLSSEHTWSTKIRALDYTRLDRSPPLKQTSNRCLDFAATKQHTTLGKICRNPGPDATKKGRRRA